MTTWVHGTVCCYKHKPCRCAKCRAANTLRQNQYRLGKREREFVDAKQARAHAQWLCAPQPGQPRAGTTVSRMRWTYATLSAHIGMDRKALFRLMNGQQERILKRYAEKLLATPDRPFFLEVWGDKSA